MADGTRVIGRLAAMPLLLLAMASAAFLVDAAAGERPAMTFYLSAQGKDGADGRSPERPMRSFDRAFSRLRPGDELVLLDGTYSAAAGTGTIHWNNGSASAQIPSGTAQRPTVVRAQNPGAVKILGPLFVGRSNRKDSYIRVQGITFEGGGSLYNSSFVTLKDVGFHGPFDIGTNDHDQGNTDNLVEDAWIWSSGVRVVAINYRAHRNVWRRVVVRGDGCGTSECSGSGNPNVGFTVYDSMDVSVQNVMVIDRVLTGSDSPYADFACAQHTADPRYYFGRNEWLGVLSLNAPDIGFYCEPDSGGTVDPTVRIRNAAVWNAAQGALNLARAGTNNVVENLLAHSLASDGIRIAPELASLGGTLRNVIVLGSGRYALNSAYPAAYVSINGSWSGGLTNQTTPTNVVAGDPRSNGALRHPVRVEAGSNLKSQGAAGADIGPSILARYGTDGTRFGDPGYNSPTAAALWPWPNEARIKAEMCASTTRGFCSTGRRLDNVNPVSLSSYVWEALGTTMPTSVGP
jgi:hypothetical protein